MIDLRGGVRVFLRGVPLAVALWASTGAAQTRAPKQTANKSSTARAAPAGQAAPAAAPAPAAPPEPEQPVGAARYGIIPPAERIDELRNHWARRLAYLRDRDERRADDEDQSLRQLKDELGLDSLFAIGAALVRESEEQRAAGSSLQARKRCELALTLAPGLPAAHLCEARAILADDPLQLRDAWRELYGAARAAARDARSSRAILANSGAVLLFGLLLAGAAFALLVFLRYAKLYFHDVHHLFPAGARRWQTVTLGAVLVLAPLLLQLGPLPLLFTTLGAVALYATTLELGIGATILLAVAATPFAIEALAREAAYGGVAADLWMIERGEGTQAGLLRLNERVSRPNLEFPVAFALARRAKREGDLPTAERLYRRALVANGVSSDSLAATHNNLGNVELLLGDMDEARSEYGKAIELRESLAPAHFNLSRALGLGGVEQLERVQAEQARALDLDRTVIDEFTGGSLQVNRHANKFVMDLRLPQDSLRGLRDSEASRADAVGDEARVLFGGFSSPELAALPPIAGALLLGFIFSLRNRVKPSGRCERCGREVCKRCDADARPSEALCAQCVNVYIRRNSVEPLERQRKEEAVELYRSRRTQVLRAMSVVSGAPHVLMGSPLAGLFFLTLTGLLAASIALWSGVVHMPNAVRAGPSILRISITAALFCIVYGLCLRDFLARQRAEG